MLRPPRLVQGHEGLGNRHWGRRGVRGRTEMLDLRMRSDPACRDEWRLPFDVTPANADPGRLDHVTPSRAGEKIEMPISAAGNSPVGDREPPDRVRLGDDMVISSSSIALSMRRR